MRTVALAPLRPRSRALAALAAAIVVLVPGLAHAVSREPVHESSAAVFLVPKTDEAYPRSLLLDSFSRSGTIGTYVELLASERVRRSAHAGNVELTARAIESSRVIRLVAQGDRERVAPALERLTRSALLESRSINDLWRLERLGGATPPSEVPPSRELVLGGVALLGGLAGLVAWVLLTLLPAERAAPGPSPNGLQAGHPPPRARPERGIEAR